MSIELHFARHQTGRDFSRSEPNRCSGALWLCLCLLLAGCASKLPQDYERVDSFAYDQPRKTKLGRFFEKESSAHPGKSGVALGPTGASGFRARVNLANMAERSLDLQYYIWDPDSAGKILAERALRAADRGVRVRILVDDISTSGTEFGLAIMDRHPNIEIRFFNPFAERETRLFQFVGDFDRLNHRMHNKAFIADNAVATVGGRNIGDDYFGLDTTANFRDLDLAVVGPVVRGVSRSFDAYWNSKWAVPVNILFDDEVSETTYQAAKARLYNWVENLEDFPYPIDTDSDTLFAGLDKVRHEFIWADARALCDSPDKLETGEQEVTEELIETGGEKEHEIVFEAAYLILDPGLIERSRLNNERGIRQRILTNSLATNDVAAAHAGYAKYRRELIKNGVELYELRPDADSVRKNWSLLAGSSKASLHTKAVVVDRETVVIGSFNMDPRSRAINTEVVVLVESPELAAQVLAYMDEEVRPENSYRLDLEHNPEAGGERLVWITANEGKEVRYYAEPDVGAWKRFSASMMSLLPIEDQL